MGCSEDGSAAMYASRADDTAHSCADQELDGPPHPPTSTLGPTLPEAFVVLSKLVAGQPNLKSDVQEGSAACSMGLGRDGDEATGTNILRSHWRAPLKQIVVTAGLEGDVVAEKCARSPRARPRRRYRPAL
jgi:hypothetical protein